MKIVELRVSKHLNKARMVLDHEATNIKMNEILTKNLLDNLEGQTAVFVDQIISSERQRLDIIEDKLSQFESIRNT